MFDTNIQVSALIFPGGQAEKAVVRIIEGQDRLLIAKAILDELLDVLARKFSRDKEELARVAVWLDEVSEWVFLKSRLHVLADAADNRILECAVNGGAAIIVTGDRGLLQLGSFEGIRIITLREYLVGRFR